MDEQLRATHDRLALIQRSFCSLYHRWELSATEPHGATIEQELLTRLPHIEPHSWPERFELGGVYLMGRPASFGQRITAPCRLEYYEPRVPLRLLHQEYPAFSSDLVLYSDADLAVVIKPAGLPTTPARDQRVYNLQSYLTTFFGSSVHLPSRLDTNVLGLVLVSRSERMNRTLQRAYDRRLVTKRYRAEVRGHPAWGEKRCQEPIERDSIHPVLRRCGSDSGRSHSAETGLVVLRRYFDSDGPRALLQAQPYTGRTHQIRLHCRHEGHPIIGDPFYGAGEPGGLRLLSYFLEFNHPYQGRVMHFELPLEYTPKWLEPAS